MKVRKRVLSAVLAATMLVTSLSAGLAVMAEETNPDKYETLLNALDTDAVRNAAWPGSATQGTDDAGVDTYTVAVNDPTGDIQAAAEAFWDLAYNEVAPNHTTSDQRSDDNTLLAVKNEISEKLQNTYGVAGDLLSEVHAALDAFTAYQNGDNDQQTGGWGAGYPSSPNKRYYVFKVTRTTKDQLLGCATVDDIPDTLSESVEYRWFHDGQNGGTPVFGGGWRNLVLVLSNDNGTTERRLVGEDTSTPTAMKAFDAFFTEDLMNTDLNTLSSDELTEIYNEATTLKETLVDLLVWDDDVLNHFFGFGTAEVNAFINDVIVTRDSRIAFEAAEQIAANMQNDPTNMERDALVALYEDMVALRDQLNGCVEEAVTQALQQYGLTMEQIDAFIVTVNEEREVIDLTGYKTAIDNAIDNAGTDLTALDVNALLSLYANIQEYMTLVSACTPEAIARVFTEGTDYVTAFVNNVYAELTARGQNTVADEIVTYYNYFNADRLSQDLSAMDTESLINEFGEANQKLGEINAKYTENGIIENVFGDKYDAITTYVEKIRQTLIDRLDAQLDEAIAKYDEYDGITILNYKTVKAACEQVDSDIATVEGLNVPQEVLDKLAQVEPMLNEYNRFVETKGLSSWKEGPVEYPVRESMPGDVARTPEETYEVTPGALDQVITNLDGLMQNQQLSDLIGLDTVITELIERTIAGELYTDATVNTVMTTVYPLIIDNLKDMVLLDLSFLGTITGQALLDRFDDLNLDIYPTTLDDHINQYVTNGTHPEWATVVTALNNIGDDWNNYDLTTSWGVHDQASFVDALSVALSGLDPILKAALTSQPMSESTSLIVSINVNVSAMSLYDRAILPLMEALGCEGMVASDVYNGYTEAKDLLGNILNPLLSWVNNKVAVDPISTVLDILPKLAYIMEFDMITEILQETPTSAVIDATVAQINLFDGSLIPQLKGNNLYELLTNILPMLGVEGLDLSMLSDINALISTVLGLVAPDANLVLPTIDQAYLASLGTLSEADSLRSSGTRVLYTSDKPAVLLAVLRYVLPMVGDQDFMDSLFALIGTMTGSEIVLSDDIMNILKGLGSNPDGVICALTELFVPQEYASKEYTYKYAPASVDEDGNPLPVNTVEYSENWTKEEAQYIADNLDEFVDNMMTILGGADMPGLGDMIRSYIADEFYTNETITSLVLMVKDALDSIGMDLTPILGLVNIDLSSWDNVTEGYDWGVIPGDSATFGDGLAKALSPFAPIMATLLSGENDLTILGTVTMKSYPGYANGIVPLLENLGCASEDIMSAEEYAALAASGNYDQMISAIIDPILNLVERIYDNPIDTIIDILPNLLYFIDCGGLQTAVENTAQAAFVLLDTVRPIYNISFDLNLNLQQIILDLLANLEVNGQKLDLKIPFLNDLSMLMVGTVTEYDSKSGLEPTYMLMNTDKADFVTVLLRNVVDLLFYQENQKVITDLIANQAGLDQETADSLLEIFNTFATMYKEDNGVDKILHAAYVIFQTTHETSDGALTEIKDFNERWNAVFDALEESGGFLADFANWADEVLDFLSFGLITGDGIGTSGLIDFFDRFVAFFQGRVTSVSIDRTSADMLVGEQTTLSLSFKPVTVKNKNATWTSSKESVATVENGVVTAVGVGDTEIKATTDDGGFVVSCVVRVRANKAALNEAIALVEGANLEGDQLAAVAGFLETAKNVAAEELASQDEVNAACAALLDAFYALELGEKVTDVTITQNGAPVGETVYQKVKWTKKWNSTPVTLGVQINGGELGIGDVKSVTWQYANWSVDKPEADIEANGMEATIRAKNSVVGAHSCWIQVTVEDMYGNTVTSNPVKVRFYNYDWQK